MSARRYVAEYAATLPKLPEATRKKIPSLTMAELLARVWDPKGPRVFHNGGTRRRILFQCDECWACFRTRPDSPTVSVIRTHAFAEWAKGYISADGTVWTKAQTETEEIQ